MPSRRAQQPEVGGTVGLTTRSASGSSLIDSKGATMEPPKAHMGTLTGQGVSSEKLQYIANGTHHTLFEEEDEGKEGIDLPLTTHPSRSSLTSCGADDHPSWQRNISPAHSGYSRHSTPSEIGDSGVSSDHDTPPPLSKHHNRPLLRHNSSDSDSESNVSSESVPDLYPSKKHNLRTTSSPSWGGYKGSGYRRSTRVKVPPSGGKATLPEALLNEIREKWAELQQRRSREQGRPGDTILGRPISSTSQAGQWSTSRHAHRRSCPASPSLSRSSSKFPSSLSLFEEDLDFHTRSSPVFFEHLYQPPLQMAPINMEDKSSLFECRDDNAGQGFAGLRDIFSPQQESTIKSCKGTVRGVKNRVRAGIATFTSDQRILKHFMERERGKVVVYTTTLGIIRNTYERCLKIRKILWTLLVRFEERDVFMARDTQLQLIDRLHARGVTVPHVFLEGQYLGDAEIIERLNECGELRRLLQPYRKSSGNNSFCSSCGGFRLLPCSVCNGSKKSVHRNDFTLEFVALKCSSCDESGLVKCTDCAEYKEEQAILDKNK